jgi:hypothetical protein
MSEVIQTDLFAEDYGHEALIKPLLERLASEQGKEIRVQVRSARGGHGRALSELELYQASVVKGVIELPDLLVVAIDANCKSYNTTRTEIRDKLHVAIANRAIYACPDPHIERWFLADSTAFCKAVGPISDLPKQKCERDVYKQALAKAIADTGQLTTLGGLEFGPEIALAMNFYRAGKADNSLKHFLDDATQQLKAQ